MRGARTDPAWCGPRGRSLLILKGDLDLSFKLVREGQPLSPFGLKLRVGCGGHVRMNGRTCSLVHASAVRVCTVPVRGQGMAVCFLCGIVRLCTPYWSLCATFSARVRALRCSAWTAQVVYLVFVCVYVRRSVCAARALYHSP